MTTDPHLDDLLDIVIGVVVADALPNEKRPRDPTKDYRAGVEGSTCGTILEFSPPAN